MSCKFRAKIKSVCIGHVRTSDSSFSDNVVANLQKQIDANKTAIEKKVNKADKATKAEVYSGTNDEKFVTPSALGSMCEKIGDVRFTTRTAIDDSWMLANGDSFDSNAYPAFLSYLSGSKSKWEDIQKVNTLAIPNNKSFYKIGNYYFINNGTSYYVSQDLQAWTQISLPTSPATYLNCVIYEGGQYKFCGYNSDSKTVIGITTNPMTNPTWTVTGMSDSFVERATMSNPIIKYGGYYVATGRSLVGSDYDKQMWYRYYTNNLLGNSYSSVTIGDYERESIVGHFLVNGTLAIVFASSYVYMRFYSSVTDANLNGDGIRLASAGYYREPLIIGGNIYIIGKTERNGTLYVYYATQSGGDTKVSGASGSICSLSKGEDGSAYLLTSDKRIYKINGSTASLMGTMTSNGTPGTYDQFLYSNNLIAYGATDKYIYGGFRNTVPNITAPTGTRAFIKVKEVS